MRRRLPGVALLLAAIPAAAAFAAGPSSTAVPASSASAVAVQVISAGGGGGSAGAVSAPPDAATSGGFAYPADGSIVTVGSLSAHASANGSKSGSNAAASAEADSISMFGGEITVGSVVGGVTAGASSAGGSGDFSGSSVSGVTALGQAASTAPGTEIALADWGYATVLSESASPGDSTGAPAYSTSITGLAVHLTADHGGLLAGSEILIGYAQASANGPAPAASPPPPPPPPPPTTTQPSPPPPPTTTTPSSPPPAAKPKPAARPKPAATTPKKPKKTPLPKPPEPPEAAPGPPLPTVHTAPLTVTPKLTGNRYVFPVYGASSYSDTFGAPRADVAWHHGDDIFAPLGAPLLAVADGTVFSVGWNHLGGYRLWLRDEAGNQFYYAHLSAYSPLAVNGNHVQAGAVLGFVGNTGDAVGTPYHLHFEVHPKSLLYLGYDGAVDPTQYLDAWRHLQDVRITQTTGVLVPPAVVKPKRNAKPAPKPAVFLIQATDISTANGLDPSSLRQAIRKLEYEGDGALVGFAESPPSGAHPVRAE
jgi:hypothetical protein